MDVALERAAAALAHGDVPIGAVVAAGGKVISSAANERELRNDPTAHAEILALRAAGEARGSWRLEDATLYVTLEPCPMCAGAAVLARVGRLVYGCRDPRAGAAWSLYNIPQDPRLNHNMPITAGIRDGHAAQLLRAFFESRRS